MIRKAYIIGTLAVGMAIAASNGLPGIARIASSARSFQQNFHNLKSAGSLNPVERFVFSLVLANSSTQGEKKAVEGPRS